MAFSDITIADATPTNVVFRAASSAAGKTIYSDASRSILEPRTFTVSHQKIGKGITARIRSVVRIDDTQVDTDGVSSATDSAYLVIDRPVSIVEAADVKHSIALVKNVLTAGNIDILLAGQQL